MEINKKQIKNLGSDLVNDVKLGILLLGQLVFSIIRDVCFG